MSEQTPNLPARPVHPGESEKNVSLREFEQRIFSLEQQINDRMRAQRELVEARSSALQKALDLQAEELKRRLEELNHAHKNAMENWAKSLPREMFEQWHAEHVKWRDMVSAQLVGLANTRAELEALRTPVNAATVQLSVLQDMRSTVAMLRADMNALQAMGNKVTGGFILLGAMGVAGTLAFVISIARLAGLIR